MKPEVLLKQIFSNQIFFYIIKSVIKTILMERQWRNYPNDEEMNDITDKLSLLSIEKQSVLESRKTQEMRMIEEIYNIKKSKDSLAFNEKSAQDHYKIFINNHSKSTNKDGQKRQNYFCMQTQPVGLDYLTNLDINDVSKSGPRNRHKCECKINNQYDCQMCECMMSQEICQRQFCCPSCIKLKNKALRDAQRLMISEGTKYNQAKQQGGYSQQIYMDWDSYLDSILASNKSQSKQYQQVKPPTKQKTKRDKIFKQQKEQSTTKTKGISKGKSTSKDKSLKKRRQNNNPNNPYYIVSRQETPNDQSTQSQTLSPTKVKKKGLQVTSQPKLKQIDDQNYHCQCNLKGCKDNKCGCRFRGKSCTQQCNCADCCNGFEKSQLLISSQKPLSIIESQPESSAASVKFEPFEFNFSLPSSQNDHLQTNLQPTYQIQLPGVDLQMIIQQMNASGPKSFCECKQKKCIGKDCYCCSKLKQKCGPQCKCSPIHCRNRK